MKRSNEQLLFVLLFYLFLIVTVLAFPLLLPGVADPLLKIIITYSFIAVASLIFIQVLGLKVSRGGFLTGSVVATASMALVFIIFMAADIVTAASLRDNFMSYLLAGVAMQLFVAFGEELSFRASIFQALDDNLGFWAAAILSSSSFALLHIPSMIFLGVDPLLMITGLGTIIAAGVTLALLYKYGGFFNAVAFHFFWNFLEYNVFGLGPMEGALKVNESGINLLTGGSFGPEASIVTMPIAIVFTAILWYYYRKKNQGASKPGNP